MSSRVVQIPWKLIWFRRKAQAILAFVVGDENICHGTIYRMRVVLYEYWPMLTQPHVQHDGWLHRCTDETAHGVHFEINGATSQDFPE